MTQAICTTWKDSVATHSSLVLTDKLPHLCCSAPQLLQARLLRAQLVQAAPDDRNVLVQRQQRRVRRLPGQQLTPPVRRRPPPSR